MYDKPVEEVNVTLKMPRFILDELDAKADEHDVSRSFLVCSIINGVLMNEDEEDEYDEEMGEAIDELIELVSDVADFMADHTQDLSVIIQPEGFQFFENGACFVRNEMYKGADSCCDDCEDCEM